MSERPDPFDLFAPDPGAPRPPGASGAAAEDALELFESERTTSENDTAPDGLVDERPATEPVPPPAFLLSVPDRDVEAAPQPRRGWAVPPQRNRRWIVLPAAVVGITTLAAASSWMNRDGPDPIGLEPVGVERSIASLPEPIPRAAAGTVEGGRGEAAHAEQLPLVAEAPVPTRPATSTAPEPERESRPVEAISRAMPAGEPTSRIPPAPAADRLGRGPESADVPAAPPTPIEPTAGLRLSTMSELSGPTPTVAPALSAPAAVPAPPDAPESGAAGNRPGESGRSQPVSEMDPDLRARQAIARTVDRYRAALTQLDSQMARSVWPSVDAGALDRAFNQLERQRVEFDHCEISHGAGQATAFCSGRAEYVPRVGNNSPRTDYRTWAISLRQSGDQWLIQQVASQ